MYDHKELAESKFGDERATSDKRYHWTNGNCYPLIINSKDFVIFQKI